MQLQARPDAWPTLATLAEAACLSPYHFIRLYQHATGETPQATMRRLKLRSARQMLASQPKRSVMEVALEHGYDSAQAFARAFRQQFGSTPSARRPDAHDDDAAAHAWVVALPALPMQAMGIAAGNRDIAATFDELMGHLDASAVPRHHQDMFCVISPGLQFSQACVMENTRVNSSLRLASQQYGQGAHLCISGSPQAVWRRWREPVLASLRHEEQPMLLRYLNDPAYRTSQEQRIELYVPLAPGAAPAAAGHVVASA